MFPEVKASWETLRAGVTHVMAVEFTLTAV
jgi:hypothetical protein